MLKTIEETVAMIHDNKLLHICAPQNLLAKLPTGNWIGGSSAYYATESEKADDFEKLCVFELEFDTFRILTYDERSIMNFTEDTYSNGFSIIIMPAETKILQEYAQNSSNYKNIFLTNVVGWVSGTDNTDKPIAVDGISANLLTDKAVALHVSLPEDKIAVVNVVNIFTADESSPIIEFDTEGFFAKEFIINGKKENIVDYAAAHNINLHLPFVGEYSGSEINSCILQISDDKVITLAAPLFKGIKYRFAKPLDNYADAFVGKINSIPNKDCVFSCNCICNMQHGDLQNHDLGGFYGPYVYGEIAYQLISQTLVYLQIH